MSRDKKLNCTQEVIGSIPFSSTTSNDFRAARSGGDRKQGARRGRDADATQTALCTYLSAILLGGLLLNALVGWWWADPVAALVMVPIIVREGLDGIRGERGQDDCGH